PGKTAALRLQKGQERMTPAQQAASHRCAAAYIRAQLSTSPVDEAAAETLLKRAYQIAGLAAPQDLHWVDGPLQLLAALASERVGASFNESVAFEVCDQVIANAGEKIRGSITDTLWASVLSSVKERVWSSTRINVGGWVEDSLWASFKDRT